MSAERPSPRHWDGLAVAVSRDRAMLGPDAAALVIRVLDAYVRIERLPLSQQAAHVRSVLDLVASQAGIGHPDVRSVDDLPSSDQWSTTAEVAEVLGVTQRHAHRLVTEEAFGPPKRVKGRWMIPTAELVAMKVAREEEQ